MITRSMIRQLGYGAAVGAFLAVSPSMVGSGAIAAATGPVQSMTIDDRSFAAQEMIGKRVVTADNQKIGEVVDLISRDNTFNDVIVKLDEENRQMGIAIGAPDPKMAGKESPVVLGGSTIAIRKEALSLAADDSALVVDRSALITVGDIGERWSARGASR